MFFQNLSNLKSQKHHKQLSTSGTVEEVKSLTPVGHYLVAMFGAQGSVQHEFGGVVRCDSLSLFTS